MKPKTRARLLQGLLIAVVGGLILFLIQTFLERTILAEPESASDGKSTSASPPPTSTSPPASSTRPPEKTEAPDGDGPSFVPTPLALDETVSREGCGNDSVRPGWNPSSPQIAGRGHPEGLECIVNTTPSIGTLEYLVPQGASIFSATVGQPDDVNNTTLTVRFEVINSSSGEVLAAREVRYGEAADFNVPVTDVLRLKLQTSLVTWTTEPSGLYGAAAWASARYE